MTEHMIPRLVIAGTNSGVGKTTVVTGLIAALSRRGLRVQSYKVGPDYIDPGYHRLASGRAAHNLDTWLVPPTELARIFATTAADVDIAIIEGVMGLFDGGRGGISSTAALAKLLGAPVLLVLDARSAGESIAATALGFKLYDPEITLAGVIVNKLGSAAHQAMVAEALARIEIPALGFIHRNAGLGVQERHLGLTPVTENDARQVVAAMADQMVRDLDIDKMLAVANSAPPLSIPSRAVTTAAEAVRIGVAQDEGFSFYYPESLAALEQLGAKIVPFSPLRDAHLPEVDGLIFGGGFPEMFLADLAANSAMKEAIRIKSQQGMPIYAECGGLMYLCRQVVGFDSQIYDMAGIVPAVCSMQSKLQTVGYVEATALSDNCLCQAGEKIRGHEFHFSCMEPAAGEFNWAFEFKKPRTGDTYPGGFVRGNVLASYLHMHFAGNPAAAARFIAQCRAFRAGRVEA